jgi:hypothetical protein
MTLGVAVYLAVVGVYWGLETLLSGLTDYERGLWEGAAIVLAINGGNAISNRVLRRVDARKEQSA